MEHGPHIRWLVEEFDRRKRERPNYSLRAFAKRIGVSPSYLSKLFKGQRLLSQEATKEILSALDFEPGKRKRIEAAVARNHSLQGAVAERLKRIFVELDDTRAGIQILDQETFLSVLGWLPNVVFQLLGSKPEGLTMTELTELLHVDASEIESAISALKNSEVIGECEGRYTKLTPSYAYHGGTLGEGGTERILDTFIENQRVLFDTAVAKRAGDERAFLMSYYIALDRDDYPTAHFLIRRFLDQLEQSLGGVGRADEVLCLNLQCYPAVDRDDGPGPSDE